MMCVWMQDEREACLDDIMTQVLDEFTGKY